MNALAISVLCPKSYLKNQMDIKKRLSLFYLNLKLSASIKKPILYIKNYNDVSKANKNKWTNFKIQNVIFSKYGVLKCLFNFFRFVCL